MSSLLVENFLAGRMLRGPGWKQEVNFFRSYATPEPWLTQAVEKSAVNLLHSNLSRAPKSVTADNPIVFNGEKYTSWEGLRDKPVENYGKLHFQNF